MRRSKPLPTLAAGRTPPGGEFLPKGLSGPSRQEKLSRFIRSPARRSPARSSLQAGGVVKPEGDGLFRGHCHPYYGRRNGFDRFQAALRPYREALPAAWLAAGKATTEPLLSSS